MPVYVQLLSLAKVFPSEALTTGQPENQNSSFKTKQWLILTAGTQHAWADKKVFIS